MIRRALTLQVLPHEPRHRGLHLATLSSTDAAELGVTVGRDGAPELFLRLLNPQTGEEAFARLDVSSAISSGRIGLQGYLMANCSVEAGQEIRVEIWQPAAERLASRLEVREVNRPTLHTQREVDVLHQRLQDSRLPLLVGHRFSFPLGDKETTFEVLAIDPPEGPVRCGSQTRLEVAGLTLVDVAPATPDATFTDIGGLEEPIRKIQELVILPARYPEVFQRLGLGQPRGIILYGPPGSGKTLLARAVANSFAARFFTLNGPEILSKWYGDSEKRLRDLFAEATQVAPSVIFIDEVDAIAASRERVSGDLEVRIVSQLLTLMDGLSGRGQVVVIAATNRLNAIDPALRRPGRFDREIEIPPPDTREREAILGVHTRTLQLAPDVELGEIARQTVGFVGADLASLCQEAALSVVRRVFEFLPGGQISQREPAPRITRRDFLDALLLVQPSAFRELHRPEATIAWDELVGLGQAKQALLEMVEWPLRRSEQLKKFGIRSGQSALLLGPAQSGKTSMAVALADHLNLSLVYLPAGDLVSQWLGEAEQAVRIAFRKARLTAPSLVLVDNFEQLLPLAAGGSDLPQRVLSQLQYELAQVRHAGSVALVVSARTGHDQVAALKHNPLFSQVVTLEGLSAVEVGQLVRQRLGQRLSPGLPLDALVEQLAGQAAGRVLEVCEEAARCALREDPDAQRLTSHHFELTMQRLAHRWEASAAVP